MPCSDYISDKELDQMTKEIGSCGLTFPNSIP